ncbi:MAG TPA: hypothetical protein PLQ20_02920 [Candidatus Paceibacterota bacterium]|nr:hypothetical protein [Candidatus Paceibacterota bacterium]
MSQAKALSPDKINLQYEPIYTGTSEIGLLIEKINCGLCHRSNFQDIKKGKSVDLFFSKPEDGLLIDIHEESIKSEFEYVKWYIRIVHRPRQPTTIVLKAVPFDINDTGSGGL